MNYFSRQALQAKLLELSQQAEGQAEKTDDLVRQIEEEWHMHSNPSITYHNVKVLAEQLIMACMEGSRVEDKIEVLYGFLQVAEQE